MNDIKSQSQVIQVMVRGMRVGIPTHDYNSDLGTLRFVLAENSRVVGQFHGALFVNNEAYSDQVMKWPRERRLCALVESPINSCYRDTAELERRFPLILTHRQELVRKGEPYRQLMFGTSWIGMSSVGDVGELASKHPIKTKRVSFIGSIQHSEIGAYQLRHEVARAMQQRTDIDCFGKGIREIPGKREALESYQFSIAMENATEDFYFSEKLIDCILLETIPIYYGCRGIFQVLNPDGLLQFNSLAELEAILGTLNDSLWLEKMPAALENKQRVLRNGWYSHRSLLDRIGAEWLKGAQQEVISTPWSAKMGLAQNVAKYCHRLGSLLRKR